MKLSLPKSWFRRAKAPTTALGTTAAPLSRSMAILGIVGKLVDPVRVREIVAALSDKRLLLEQIATELNISVEALLSRISEISGLTTTIAVPTTNINNLLACGRSLAEFRTAGAIPIFNGKMLEQIVCVDPATVRSLLKIEGAINYTISNWQRIAAALDESVAIYSKEAEALQLVKERAIAQAALSAIIGEVASFQRSAVSIIFTDITAAQGPRYEFTTVDTKRAHGTVSPRVNEALKNLLSSALGEDSLEIVVSLRGGGKKTVLLSVEGDEGIFRVRWGQQRAEQQQVAQEQASRSVAPVEMTPQIVEESVEQPLVFVVDDNPTFGAVLRRFLERHGCKTAYADSGAAALQKLDSGELHPALILCDVHMPTMNGFSFVRELRARQDFAITPVVMLTSDDETDVKVQLLGDGADAFVAKHEDPRVLWVQVKRLLDRSRGVKKAAA